MLLMYCFVSCAVSFTDALSPGTEDCLRWEMKPARAKEMKKAGTYTLKAIIA